MVNFSFSVTKSNKELIEYIKILQDKRELSEIICKFLIEHKKQDKNILKLQLELKQIKENSSKQEKELKKLIIETKTKAEKLELEFINLLKRFYNGDKKDIINFQKFCDTRSEFISRITGEKKEDVINRVIKKIKNENKKVLA